MGAHRLIRAARTIGFAGFVAAAVAACSAPADQPGSVSADEQRMLNEAAAMLDANAMDANLFIADETVADDTPANQAGGD